MHFVEIAALLQLEYFGRVFLAAVCGAAIGYERENRLKMAGIRTHLIVAIGASLMMVVSKYGFNDMLALTGVGLDPSRIAAGIVTSIGFLGAGVIFIRNRENVSGITTAAGLWATVGIGMAIGAGMYYIGVGITLLILFVQILLHRNTKLVRESVGGVIVLRAASADTLERQIQRIREIRNMEISSSRVTRLEDGMLELKLSVKCPRFFDIRDMLLMMEELPELQSFEM